LTETLEPSPLEDPDALTFGSSDARRLVVTSADMVRSVRLVAGSTLRVGRLYENDIVIAHEAVSRLHALIRVTDRVAIEDAGSRNGTYCNGSRLRPARTVVIEPGAVVQIGPATLFLVEGAAPARVSIPRREIEATTGAKSRGSVRPGGPPLFVVKDERMAQLCQSTETIASSGVGVLVLGESGVGKELLASTMHSMSPRHEKPFVTFNSAALPDSLAEKALFGFARGAFRGADRSKPGLFDAADGGTMFLDEVSDLSPQVQAKLLRVIETGEVLSLGGVKPKSVDVRVIAASTSDLFALTTMGRFRSDLFYRLSGATLHIPPLRERPADVPALAQHFAARTARAAGLPEPELDAYAISALVAHHWPGNVRELENVVQRAVILARGPVIRASDLQLQPGVELGGTGSYAVPSTSGAPLLEAGGSWEASVESTKDGGVTRKDLLRQELAREERTRIIDALTEANGNQVIAARLLGVSRGTLVKRLDAYQIPRPRKGQR
jgi:DNA-binding NtrC family response regulator